MNYLRDPDKIYLASFEAINNEVNLSKFPKSLHNIILRLIHATAMPDIINNIIWDGDVLGNAIKNIKNDKPILVDANMILAGIKKSLLPAGLQVKCFLDADGVLDIAKEMTTTRSAAAVEFWRPFLDGAIVSIGNAPTALFHLLDMLEDPGCPRPAVIFGFPVGFIGAAESKAHLIEKDLGIPYITLKGRLGGSALAAAAINAVLFEATK